MQTLSITGEALIIGLLLFINIKLKKIVMTQAELQAELVALKAQNEKAKGEIVGKIAALEAAIANQGNTTPEVDAALADLKVSVQGTDDIVPDPAPVV
jgi:uncharacterized membrane-anchored protein YhcB (DUF1043 family)